MSDNLDDTQDKDSEDDYKSKTQVKKEMLALQDLGAALVKLSPSQLADIPLEDDLRQAITQAQSIKKFGALKRQLQYIGKLMRAVETNDIEKALHSIQHQSAEQTQQLHRIERLRDTLLAGENEATTKLFAQYPNIDRQHLRQLVRRAQQEISQNKPPSTSRKLFRYLREIDNQQNNE